MFQQQKSPAVFPQPDSVLTPVIDLDQDLCSNYNKEAPILSGCSAAPLQLMAKKKEKD